MFAPYSRQELAAAVTVKSNASQFGSVRHRVPQESLELLFHSATGAPCAPWPTTHSPAQAERVRHATAQSIVPTLLIRCHCALAAYAPTCAHTSSNTLAIPGRGAVTPLLVQPPALMGNPGFNAISTAGLLPPPTVVMGVTGFTAGLLPPPAVSLAKSPLEAITANAPRKSEGASVKFAQYAQPRVPD